MSEREDRIMDVVDTLRESEKALSRLQLDDFADEDMGKILTFKADLRDWLEQFRNWEEQERDSDV